MGKVRIRDGFKSWLTARMRKMARDEEIPQLRYQPP